MKIKKHFLSTNSFYKKMLIIGCGTVICLSFITFLLLSFQLRKYVNNNISQYEEKKVQKTAAQLEDYFSQTVNSVVGIDNMITVPVYELKEGSDYWNTFLLKQNISSYIHSMPFLSGINYVDASNDIFSGTVENAESYSLSLGHYKNCELFVSENIKWPMQLRFSFSNLRSKKKIDVFIKLNYISDLLFDENTFLTDKNGTIIMSVDNHLLGKNLYQRYGLDKNQIENGISNSEYFIKYEKIDNIEANLITITSKSNYKNQFMDIIATGLLLILPITGIEIVLIILFIRTLSRPILDISKTMKYYFPHNEKAFESEFSYINESIKNTIESNNIIKQEIPKIIEKSKYSQAQAVYSQINPHFLFNTLDNLKWRSVLDLGVDNNIEKICILLQKIIYECLQQSDMISTIKKEIEIANTYIALMQIRYENTFSVDWDVDEEIKTALIIKLTLQPLLENSIMHSFEPNKPGQKIAISIKKETENSIIITVSDNGKGIDKEKLKKIQNSLKDEEPSSKHIGIKNVHLRYRLLYGEEFGIIAIESDNTGTRVHLRTPYHKF